MVHINNLQEETLAWRKVLATGRGAAAAADRSVGVRGRRSAKRTTASRLAPQAAAR